MTDRYCPSCGGELVEDSEQVGGIYNDMGDVFPPEYETWVACPNCNWNNRKSTVVDDADIPY